MITHSAKTSLMKVKHIHESCAKRYFNQNLNLRLYTEIQAHHEGNTGGHNYWLNFPVCDGFQWLNVSIIKVNLEEDAFVFYIFSWMLGL